MEKNEKNISKMIKRYPYNGRSNYLIDKFYIIGFNIPTLKKILYEDNNFPNNIILEKKQNEDDKNKLSTHIQPFHLKEDPVILNEFTSDYNKDCLDFKLLKEMIFPNKITLYYIEEDLSSIKKNNEIYDKNADFFEFEENECYTNDFLKTSSVVFSSNPQIENSSKKSINGFAYIFYKELKRKRIKSKKLISFYIPIIFCTISEYPFYNSFYKLSQQIKFLFEYPKLEIPIEIMLHYIINTALSPLNSDVNLSIKPLSCLDEGNDGNKNRISVIPEAFNEDEDHNSINNDENAILRKKTSDDFFNGSKAFKTIDPIVNKHKPLKRFTKKKSVILPMDTINLIKKQQGMTDEKEFSPHTPRKSIDLRDTDSARKKKQTVTDKEKKKNKYIDKLLINYNMGNIFTKIKFELLSGYPLIQYNLAKVLFYTLSPADVIEIFFYTFLEKDVIFFSKNLEYLSLTINSYFSLNFPLNDEKYYFINASVSYENYMNNNSTFVGSTFTTVLGINSQYQQKYLESSNKLKEHLAVDLDKGEIHKIEDKNDKAKSKQNKELFNLIRKICNKKELKSDKKYNLITKEVYLLHKTLNSLVYGNNENDSNNIKNDDFKKLNFLDYDNKYIKKINMEIQDSFYRLINNLCLYFYQNLSIKTEDDDMNKRSSVNKKGEKREEMNVIFRDDYKLEEESVYTKEELFFLDELRDTMKYESFVYNFVQSYSPIDLYKIPLTFTEEFLEIISRKNSILEKVNFFEIIDKLYNQKKSKTIEIDFKSFNNIYYKSYKDYFDREINDINDDEDMMNDNSIKLKYVFDENKNKKYLKYKSYEIDNNLLMNYLYLINNLEKNEYNQILNLSDILSRNVPKDILVIDIENLIENYSIETKLLSLNDLCCSNIILLMSLSLNFWDMSIDFKALLATLFNEFTIFRKYYSYILKMILLLFTKSINEEDYHRAHEFLLCYYICVNSIRNLKLVPNENLMNIIKKFNEIDLEKFDKNYKSQQGKEENKINIKEEKSPKLNKVNILTCYNFSSKRIFNEKEIIDLINDKNNKDDSSIMIGRETIQPRIRIINSDKKIITYFYSQTSLLTQLINVYNEYVIDLKESHIGPIVMIHCCLNILVYMRNSPEFSDKNEIKEIVEIILFLFLNKFVEN